MAIAVHGVLTILVVSLQTHKADNLLSSDTYRKWKAAKAGEKQTSVIIQVIGYFCTLFLWDCLTID
jgi:hypothetical protein